MLVHQPSAAIRCLRHHELKSQRQRERQETGPGHTQAGLVAIPPGDIDPQDGNADGQQKRKKGPVAVLAQQMLDVRR